jgi:hypothetical protein
MGKRLIWIFAIITLTLTAQVTPDASSLPFTADEIAIYRDFLLHYPEQPSNMIGMQETTVPFPSAPKRGEIPPPADLVLPKYSGRRLPPEVLSLTGEAQVTARIAARGKLVPPGKRGSDTGPDGYVRTHLTLSEIAFDPEHQHAAFIFSASCDCLGGQGGMAVYVRRHGHWKLDDIAPLWVG